MRKCQNPLGHFYGWILSLEVTISTAGGRSTKTEIIRVCVLFHLFTDFCMDITAHVQVATCSTLVFGPLLMGHHVSM